MSAGSDPVTVNKNDTQEDSIPQHKSVDIQSSNIDDCVENKKSNDKKLKQKQRDVCKSSHLDNENAFSNDDSKRKRSRRSYNCGPCKKHKIKCDMSTPCGNCVKYNRTEDCFESPPNPPTYQQFLIQQQRRRKYLEKKDKKHVPSDSNNTEPTLVERYNLKDNQVYQKDSNSNMVTPFSNQSDFAFLEHSQQNFYPPLQVPSIQMPHVPTPQHTFDVYPIQTQIDQQHQPSQSQQQSQQQQQQISQQLNHPPNIHTHSYPFISQRPIVIPRYHSLDPYILHHPNSSNGATPINYSNQTIYSQPPSSQPPPPPPPYVISQSRLQPGMLIQPLPYGMIHPVVPAPMNQPYIPNNGSFVPGPSFPQVFTPVVSEQLSSSQSYSKEPESQPSSASSKPSSQKVKSENELLLRNNHANSSNSTNTEHGSSFEKTAF
ncbi:hypothetical protein CANINC_003680 [Pichia inconspicua]|uniref:Zn(2)-C6 fungal-type domain-containing protein n=1 Tax=Pichia inconspicua TaxID=52247 RepID=A0A4T0WY11_9ASCO|nr:hypothetical protein CANINC_003680 [[Candida] inconspicua]